MAGMLGSLPSAQSILGQTPGSSAQRRRRAPQQAAQGGQQQPPPSSAPQQTFAQLQQAGMARPAPPPAPTPQAIPQYGGSPEANATRSQLSGAVQQALTAPSRYDASTFTQLRDAARGDLENQFGRIREQTNEDLARRGLSASTFGANALHDVAGSQSRALADIDAQLLREAATTQAGDRQAAFGMGSTLAGLAGSQDLAAYGANANARQQNFGNQLSSAQFGQGQYDNATQLALAAANAQSNQSLGQGGLALQVGQALGNVNGQQTLGAQQLTQQGQQFNLQQALTEKLGVGNLGVEQQRAATEAQGTLGNLSLGQGQLSLARTGQEQQYGLAQRQQGLSETLGLAGLSLDQQKLALDQMVQSGQLTLAQKNQALNELQNRQQFGMQQQQFGEGQRQFNLQQALQQQLGLGNLGLGQQDLALRQLSQQQGNQLAQQQLTQQGALGQGQLDVSRYQAEADANLARQNLLMQVIGALGLGNGGGSGAGGSGGGSGIPGLGGFGGGNVTMPGAGGGGPPPGSMFNTIPTDSFTTPFSGPSSGARAQPIFQNGQWWDPNTGWSTDGRNFSSAIASIANVRSQPMMQGGQPFEAGRAVSRQPTYDAQGHRVLSLDELMAANPGASADAFTPGSLVNGEPPWLAEQRTGQARGNFGQAVQSPESMTLEQLQAELAREESPEQRAYLRSLLADRQGQ